MGEAKRREARDYYETLTRLIALGRIAMTEKLGLRKDLASPCMGCQERKPACHDRCEAYQTWRRETLPKRDIQEDAYIEQDKRRCTRAQKRHGKNKGTWRYSG